mmetsp:Transcript_18305/g.39101  ORF Transcript_18305/g.39101 Transcript_18305/m.39101 type:complete len:271 (+) Transcript_18305:115-927(+)|eukprot:CAMPEP_0206477734 /NCGR_PEP_ID=MMETSP0324_2-20121206/35597_1 /ASSEMBLY_ACC=CAM_ASM_000836 /TAXON_ID=2866 /ORGANISM="Crypthecodinium cohnii, Strain Seligo" /LENGTH=270 /DNA_ID=CAMNT_0053953831 /DNA_START=112 /DNA_END=924 /DNA_ORIENTATION=+
MAAFVQRVALLGLVCSGALAYNCNTPEGCQEACGGGYFLQSIMSRTENGVTTWSMSCTASFSSDGPTCPNCEFPVDPQHPTATPPSSPSASSESPLSTSQSTTPSPASVPSPAVTGGDCSTMEGCFATCGANAGFITANGVPTCTLHEVACSLCGPNNGSGGGSSSDDTSSSNNSNNNNNDNTNDNEQSSPAAAAPVDCSTAARCSLACTAAGVSGSVFSANNGDSTCSGPSGENCGCDTVFTAAASTTSVQTVLLMVLTLLTSMSAMQG